MINNLGKALVLLHVSLSIAAMTWAALIFIQPRDFGWLEPYREAVAWDKEGNEKGAVRYASEYDKSTAAVKEAVRMRDLTYVAVKPALDAIREAEPYLPNNHLFFLAELDRLRNAPGNIEVKRLKDAGFALDTPGSKLGKPVFEDAKLETINKSLTTYESDLKKLFKEIDEIEADIRKVVAKTKKYTTELTGLDEMNKYLQPGLYQLIDLEYKTQVQLKAETDEIKPHWSKAIEQSRLYLYRRADLEATLDKLVGAKQKNDKK